MPDPLAGYKTILLFGGSFDPPHRAHVQLPQQAAQAIGADLIAYIPAGRAPHKLDRQQTDPPHRLAMLRLALADQPCTIKTTVLTDEIARGPDLPSYTVDTLKLLIKRIDPGATLRLLIGADQLRMFESWREPERVVELAEPVVMVRPPDTRDGLLAFLPEADKSRWASRMVDVDQLDISSTQVRQATAQEAITNNDVCKAVADYIQKHRLYQ